MRIRATLEDLVMCMEGCRATVLVAADGMAVDAVVVDGIVDAEMIAAGTADILTRAGRFVREIRNGGLEELVLHTPELVFLARPVSSDYYLMAIMDPEGNFGLARLELRRAAASLLAELDPDRLVPDTQARC